MHSRLTESYLGQYMTLSLWLRLVMTLAGKQMLGIET